MVELIYHFFNLRAAVIAIPFLLRGLFVTIQVSALSFLLAASTGLALTLIRSAAPRPLGWLLLAYIDLLRGMPPVVLMMLVFFTLPALGVHLPVTPAAVVSLALYGSAYAAEIFRGALDGVPTGQRDAARALGLSSRQAMRYVILPQAFSTAIPPLTSEAIALVKLSSVGYVIGLQELLGQARQAQELTANMTPLIAGALTYLLLLVALERLAQVLESRTKRQTSLPFPR